MRQRFRAIHTYISEEHKKQVLAAPFEEDKITDIEWAKLWEFKKCSCIAAWQGNDDFFFGIGKQIQKKIFMKRSKKMG